MKKKLLAAAVAGAFALPGAALAQSSVTISGFFKQSFEGYKLANSAKSNASVSGLSDDSSRIIFNVVEDLGGGLRAIAQLDIRFKPDDVQGAAAAVGGTIPSGNTWVGLQSPQWGRLVVGRLDLHYGNTESTIEAKTSLRGSSVSLLAHARGETSTGVQPAGAIAIAGATRTQNVIHYMTPNWGGFTLAAAYSSNPTGADADMGSGMRKGNAWQLHPMYTGPNWRIGYSWWRSKPDDTPRGGTPPVFANDQRGDRLHGHYRWGTFQLGFAWDKSKVRNHVTGAQLSDRTAWSIPASYTWGPHEVHAHYTRARDDKATPGVADGAKMFAIGYAYNLSKRTSVGVSYARINNDTGAAYNFFTAATLGLANAAIAGGEDPRLWAVTLRHAF